MKFSTRWIMAVTKTKNRNDPRRTHRQTRLRGLSEVARQSGSNLLQVVPLENPDGRRACHEGTAWRDPREPRTMKRVWYPYQEWEDFQAGMWRILPKDEEPDFTSKAIDFTGNHALYGSYMMRVVSEWPIACAQNFTAPGINKQAWVGHAACCLAINCPEYITRRAWKELTQEQRDLANNQADIAVRQWRKNARENPSIYQNLGTSRLSGGDSGRSGFCSRIPQQGRLFSNDLLGDS